MSKNNKGDRRRSNRNKKNVKNIKKNSNIRNNKNTENSLFNEIKDDLLSSNQENDDEFENLSSEEMAEKIENDQKEIDEYVKNTTTDLKKDFDKSSFEAKNYVRNTYRSLLKSRFDEVCRINKDNTLTQAEIRNNYKRIIKDINHIKATISSLDEQNTLLGLDNVIRIHPISISSMEVKPFLLFSLLRRLSKAFKKRAPEVKMPSVREIVEILFKILVVSKNKNKDDEQLEEWNLFIETCIRLSSSILASDIKSYAPIVWYGLFRNIIKADRQGKHEEARLEVVDYIERLRYISGDVGYVPSFIISPSEKDKSTQIHPSDKEKYAQRLAHYLREH